MDNKIFDQPTYKRQRFLLDFIGQLKDAVTSTDLQKLVFLCSMEQKLKFYNFIPYKYGPYSFQLAEDIDVLVRDGYLNFEGSRVRAVKKGSFSETYLIDPERGTNLVRKAYRKYPYYAINSQIAHRLFSEKELERFKQERKRLTKHNQVLYTIGYEGKSIEEFVNILIQNDIMLLCDIRRNPISRKFGFSKGRLKHIVETCGIKYEHIPDLGIASEKRKNLDTVDDYQDLFEEYAKRLPNHELNVAEVVRLLNSNERIALMCYEKEPEMCHRHVLSDYISEVYMIGSVNL